jgi:hypothetical protein
METTLLIDDFRELNCDKTCRTVADGIKALQEQIWDELYLDHDLGIYASDERTGYDVLCWLEANPQFLPKKIILVTSNPVGRQRMQQALDKLYVCP